VKGSCGKTMVDFPDVETRGQQDLSQRDVESMLALRFREEVDVGKPLVSPESNILYKVGGKNGAQFLEIRHGDRGT